jgi:hypothetical protein
MQGRYLVFTIRTMGIACSNRTRHTQCCMPVLIIHVCWDFMVDQTQVQWVLSITYSENFRIRQLFAWNMQIETKKCLKNSTSKSRNQNILIIKKLPHVIFKHNKCLFWFITFLSVQCQVGQSRVLFPPYFINNYGKSLIITSVSK